MSSAAPTPRPVQRLAAFGALLALVGAMAAAGYVLVHNPAALPVTLLALLGAVIAGWLALINRGARRVTGLLIAVAALALMVLLIGPDIAWVTVVVLLAAASAACARVAIGPHRPRAPGPEVSVAVKPAERPVLIINPGSGGADPALAAAARRRGIKVVTLGDGDDLRTLADRAVRAEPDRGSGSWRRLTFWRPTRALPADAIGVAGGDGSQALVADLARQHDIAFVCVPAGTRNHFAQDLGLNRTDPIAALDGFGRAVERRVDLGRVNGRVFVNNVSLGAYAMLVQAEEYRAAKLTTAAAMLPDLLGAEAVPFDLRFNGPDGEAYSSAVLVLVSNNPYAVATAAGLAGRPRIDTGELGVVVISGGLRQWTASALRVESDGPVPVGIDGETLQMQPPLEFEALPDALRVRLPRGTIAPAAVGRVPGFRQTAAALVRILRNRPPWT
jgi:diacylglycerol kinase family enzyme